MIGQTNKYTIHIHLAIEFGLKAVCERIVVHLATDAHHVLLLREALQEILEILICNGIIIVDKGGIFTLCALKKAASLQTNAHLPIIAFFKDFQTESRAETCKLLAKIRS